MVATVCMWVCCVWDTRRRHDLNHVLLNVGVLLWLFCVKIVYLWNDARVFRIGGLGASSRESAKIHASLIQIRLCEWHTPTRRSLQFISGVCVSTESLWLRRFHFVCDFHLTFIHFTGNWLNNTANPPPIWMRCNRLESISNSVTLSQCVRLCLAPFFRFLFIVEIATAIP